jgi:hypothetical protein
MAYQGTRETSSWWKKTSIKKLMKAEKDAWEIAAKGLNYLDSYFVPIEFDQRYPFSLCDPSLKSELELSYDGMYKIDYEDHYGLLKSEDCVTNPDYQKESKPKSRS